jgi:NAD(P)-dependent dehydrogenase (short-subunit alcohol dehydrogenase family)
MDLIKIRGARTHEQCSATLNVGALKDAPITVNAAHPGIVKTDPNPNAPISPEEGARTSVALARLPDDGPTSGFFPLGGSVPW